MTNQPDLTPLLGDESKPITFPSGLIGLDEWKKFVVIKHPEADPLRLLQSLDESRASFIVADPRDIMPEYRVKLSGADAQAIQYTGQPQLAWPGEVDVFCILSVEEEPFNVTANLLGPVVINWRTGLGRQVILSESNYATCHPVARAETAGGD